MNFEALLITKYIDAYNHFDVEGLLQLVSDDIRFENIESDTLTVSTNGKDALRLLARESAQQFTSRRQTVADLYNSDASTIAEIDFYGKLAADLPNGLMAGEEITLRGKTEFAFRDGKICLIRDIS